MVVFPCKQTLAGVQGKDNPLLAVDEINNIVDISAHTGNWTKPCGENDNNYVY